MAEPVVVLLSGGRDSVCLLHVLVDRGLRVTALHVNYGLREQASMDEAFCRSLCEGLDVPLRVVRAGSPAGNVQAWARAVRYAAAFELEGDVAVGHTATDQVETVLYRLAASPGRRALLGMRERDGRVIRPLLRMTREETAAYNRAHGLAWREDASNDDPVYARNRARAGLVPALRELHPAAEANVLRTLELLRDEAEVLDSLVADAAARPFADLPPALQRLVLQHLTDQVVSAEGGSDPAEHSHAVGSRAEEVAALARRGGSGRIELGAGLAAVVEYGDVRVQRPGLSATAPGPAPLSVPGTLHWADALIRAEGEAQTFTVRSRRPGDRIRTRAGTKTLQDHFVDQKVPRARRHLLPVVTCEERIVWVPGAISAEFEDRVRLSWS